MIGQLEMQEVWKFIKEQADRAIIHCDYEDGKTDFAREIIEQVERINRRDAKIGKMVPTEVPFEKLPDKLKEIFGKSWKKKFDENISYTTSVKCSG